ASPAMATSSLRSVDDDFVQGRGIAAVTQGDSAASVGGRPPSVGEGAPSPGPGGPVSGTAPSPWPAASTPIRPAPPTCRSRLLQPPAAAASRASEAMTEAVHAPNRMVPECSAD